ncbi:hypothetical protein SAY87_031250 [Trapa incisa]|uniref:Protein kinase domain-containing protein n=1 Tax=Trapa incisa TaxID=236973 RepID=A0AAN7QMU7_9MYRT|nr:hypothetical protein SAY87_031250 [Trapa incisa]
MYSSSMEEQGDVLCFERRRFSMCRIGARLHLFLFLLSLATFSRQAASAADGTAVVQSPEPASKNSRADPRISVPLIAVSGLFVAVLFAVAVLQLLRRRLRRRRSRSVVVASEYCGDTDAVKDAEAVGNALVAAAVVREFNWEDIKKMTSYFGEIIGSGGFSTVYMGRLAEETGAWSGLSAVKVHSSSERLNIAFKQELDILLRIRHQNIVKLIGFCDKEGEGGALVLEYVMNGNLQEKLHGRHGNGRAVDTCPSVLSWRNRTAIAFQLARAIEYLHEKCSPQIVHGDIKPSNVLLDDSLNCKLCDFGSAKMGFSSLVQFDYPFPSISLVPSLISN